MRVHRRVLSVADKYDCPLVRERCEKMLLSRCLRGRMRCDNFRFQDPTGLGLEWLQLCQRHSLHDLGWFVAYDLGSSVRGSRDAPPVDLRGRDQYRWVHCSAAPARCEKRSKPPPGSVVPLEEISLARASLRHAKSRSACCNQLAEGSWSAVRQSLEGKGNDGCLVEHVLAYWGSGAARQLGAVPRQLSLRTPTIDRTLSASISA
eukprot:365594-Chlamydomonas_euryale.AAC.2